MIFLQFIVLFAGFFVLILGADWFVDGSSGVAKKLHVPELIIGLTIVAMGTSAPELAVSTSAALQGSNEIAISNVIGSNIFNLLAVLGICALLHPVTVDRAIIKRDFPLDIAATILVFCVSCGAFFLSGKFRSAGMEDAAGTIGRPAGLMLIALLACYIAYLVFDAKKHPSVDNSEDETSSMAVYGILILAGLALIIVGGQAVVSSAKEIARRAGMTETLIGLTIVAIGTSLPELVTSAVAAGKGKTELALGNALGSNLFNILLILGVSSSIHPITVNFASTIDFIILIVISIIAFIFSMTSEKISRKEGAVMIAIYIADVVFAVLR